MPWDESDSDWFDGFLEAMFWFFGGPWWVYVLIVLGVAAYLYFT